MKKNISVFTTDKYLFQKILLELCEEYNVRLGNREDFDIALFDLDSFAGDVSGAITMSRHRDADISLPFSLGSLSEFLHRDDEKIFYLDLARRSAFLRGEEIKLTDVEFSLISVICEGAGDFVSREEILKRVWDNNADGGVINVYVHYLREKLERYGEKIIISSRKGGYKLNEKYLGGAVCKE